MENKNYGEIFCQATEILAQHLIEQISFDRTILCTIVDDSEKNIGKYRVSNTDMTFDAYTSDTNYKIHDNVYVSIPGGDWNEQKLIVSKKANDSETMVEYINPYDRFINITNNIIPTNNLTAGLVANDINKKQILLWNYNSKEDSTLKSGGEVYAGYTRLALSGSFQTLLKSFDVRFGDYGLNLVIKTAAADSDKTAIKVCNLSCADMTGNPYNYQGFFPQAKIFDISNINQVIEMELWFYQKAGSFKNAQGAAIPYENMSSNILVKDINVALGYDTQSFDKDTLILYTQDLTDYDVKEEDVKNHKKLEVRWIHKFDENGKIKVVELNDGIDYNLTFYRHTLGEPSHSVWSGVDWAFLSSQTVAEGEVSYKCADAARDPSYNTVWLKPDYNKAQERIKTILTYNNNEEVLFSSILTINNANEVVSQETVNAVSALNINCEDNSNGNYFLYRLDGKILDPAYSQIKRAFKLYFNTYGDTSGSLVEAESIEWIIPANNTMINLYPDQGQELKDDGFYHVKIENNNNSDVFNLYYTINSSHRQQNNNNTVKCVVVRNQIEYTAIKELSFGTAGTAGTDYSFVLDFADNRYNALTIGEVEKDETNKIINKIIKVEATLYDYAGKKLDISGRTINWSLTTDGNDDKSHNDDGYIIRVSDTDSNKTGLQLNPNKTIAEVPDDNYTILKAVLTDWGDFNLEAYLPIPIRLSKDYQFISGATTIVYNSLGNLDNDTFQNPYIIYKKDGVESIKGNWSIRSGVVNDPCIPSLEIAEDGTKLKPISIYVEDTMAKLCITGSIINNEEKSIKVWSQPIYAYQNKYPTSIINDWNGELQINKEGNSILAAKIVAGKKDPENNTFTGVIMGDWDDSDTENVIRKNTGIYGFQQGKASFGFKDDGTAFIGQAGKGRLEFNGQESIIQSSVMSNSNIGMKMNFDKGYIQLSQDNGQNQIWIDASQGTELPIRVGEKEKFKVNWEGKITATDGNFTGKVTAESGIIGAWNILGKNESFDETVENVENTEGTLYAKNMYLFPDGRLRIGSLNNAKFEVDPDGNLYAESANITGGLISIKDDKNNIIFNADKEGFNLANGRFEFKNDTLSLKDVTIQWSGDGAVNSPEIGNIDGLENYLDQLDGRIQTYSQKEDPSESWNKNDYQSHTGDLWINPDDGITQRWNGSSWEVVTDSELKELAESKAQIFTSEPVPPYYVGDLWVQGSNYTGDIKHCIQNRATGSYIASDWVISSKYTDDTVAKQALEQAKQGIADAARGIELANAAQDAADNALGRANEAETNAKDYAVLKDGSLSETLTKAYKEYTDSEVSELDSSVARYLGLGGNTLIGTNYVVSPYIGGGYLNITDVENNSNSRVIIDPNNLSGTGYIFQVHNNEQISVGIDRNGNALFQGSIYATSLTLGDNVTISTDDVSGLSSVATSGNYNDLKGKPTIPTKVSELDGIEDIIMKDDISISTSENNGIITTTTIVGDNTYTTYTSKESNYLLTNLGVSNEESGTYFMVEKNGLLTAKNAMIWGTIYANAGIIGGCSISNGKLQVPSANITGTLTADSIVANANIQSPTISSGKIQGSEIYASTFYAVEGDKNTYATMESDGFKIYHGSTVNNEPKMKLVTENEGKNIVLKLGAGANDENYENEGRLVFEKYTDHAEIYYMVNHTPYGFKFSSSGVTMLGGGAFDVGTQAYAVFG